MLDDVKERSHLIDAMRGARQTRSCVEAEAVDMHLFNPVAQTIEDELKRARVHHVWGVTTTRIIAVIAEVLGHQIVVTGVINATKAQSRPKLVAFSGVVVHNIEDNFNICGMEGLHHGLELRHFPTWELVAGIAPFRREETDGVVSPVVAQPAIHQALILDKPLDRHQLYGGDSQRVEVVNTSRADQAAIGAPQSFRHLRVADGESSYMHLINDRLVPVNPWVLVVLPIEAVVHDHALGSAGGTIAVVA